VRHGRVCAIDCDVAEDKNLDMVDTGSGPGHSGGPVLCRGRVSAIVISIVPCAGTTLCLPVEEFMHDLKLE
jgi:hypothetical protein